MATPAQPDPRRRRWTIVIFLLVLVVLGGALFRIAFAGDGDDGGGNSDRTGDRTEQESTDEFDLEPAPDGDTDDPLTQEEADDPTVEEATETRIVNLRTDEDIDGSPYVYVDRLGPINLTSSASLPYVTTLLGDADLQGADRLDENTCAATWSEVGLDATFFYGHPPSLDRSCTEGPLVTAVLTGEGWRVDPLGIGIGDDEDALLAAVPDARSLAMPDFLRERAGTEQAYLIATSSYAGDPFPTLYAGMLDGEVASLAFVSGAD